MNFALVPFTCFGEDFSGVLPLLPACLGLWWGLGTMCDSTSLWTLISGVLARVVWTRGQLRINIHTYSRKHALRYRSSISMT